MRSIPLILLCTKLLNGGAIYSVVDLGTLGGSSAIAYKINDSGTAVGWAQTPDGSQHAFVSNGGGLQDLSPFANSNTHAYGINAAGTIAGDLGNGVFATGINDVGVVVGTNGHAFELANGTLRDLGLLPGGDWSSAYDINNSGYVVGYGTTGSGAMRGFVWNPSQGIAELGTLGGRDSHATAINDSGEIVGNASLVDGTAHAFVAIGAMMTDLGTLGSGSYAQDINDAGETVGYSWLSSGANTHAFLYQNGTMLDLNALISAWGWELLAAYGINNNGQIVGEGLFQGQAHAFRLDPIESASYSGAGQDCPVSTPDPGTATLALIGLSLVALSRIRRRRR